MSFVIDQTDEEFSKEVTQIITADLCSRFPDGVPEEYMKDITEAMLSAFYNGCRFTEEMLRADDAAVKEMALTL
jgi:hypothetical protein